MKTAGTSARKAITAWTIWAIVKREEAEKMIISLLLNPLSEVICCRILTGIITRIASAVVLAV
jgi:hypothetical protein